LGGCWGVRGRGGGGGGLYFEDHRQHLGFYHVSTCQGAQWRIMEEFVIETSCPSHLNLPAQPTQPAHPATPPPSQLASQPAQPATPPPSQPANPPTPAACPPSPPRGGGKCFLPAKMRKLTLPGSGGTAGRGKSHRYVQGRCRPKTVLGLKCNTVVTFSPSPRPLSQRKSSHLRNCRHF